MNATTALLRKDLRTLRNLGRVMRSQSRLKILVVAAFATGLLAGLFILFVDGLRFLSALGGSSFLITRRLFALFFLVTGILLIVSSVVTSYATLFRSRETPYLLVHPAPIPDIVSYKFMGSALLDSWAFFFMIVPFAAAYAWHERLGLMFCVWVLAFSIPLMILCSGLGSLVSMLLARWTPHSRPIIFCILLAAALAAYTAMMPHANEDPGYSPTFVMSRLVPGLRASSNPWFPSWWAAEGIMACTRADLRRGLLLWCTLMSNMLLVCLLVRRAGAAMFYEAFQRATGSRGHARVRCVLLPWIERALGCMPRDVRGLVAKDVRTFLRDPMQWSQVLIFFGLLALYFGGLRSFRYDLLPMEWRNLIAFLNVFSVSAVLCSLSSRFVYPQLSLEGQAFWMLGLAPTSAGRILTTKFAISLIGATIVSVALMLLSSRMLALEPGIRITTLGLVTAVSCAVCGLSTGLGAIFLDLEKDNPAAIVSGFGGTVNLVLGLSFMLAAIIPFGLIFHLQLIGRMAPGRLAPSLVKAVIWLLAITAAATIVPLRLGRRSLAQREY